MSFKKSQLSKEEIVKQFDLPERKSKIATILKQDEQAYCICRSSDSSRFMIGCDACEEWYHGDCIDITEKEAKNIKQYFCVRCQDEDSTLVTRYKTQKTEAEKIDYRKRREEKEQKKRCGVCSNCLRREDCGHCSGCRDRAMCVMRICRYRRDRSREKSYDKYERSEKRFKKERAKTKPAEKPSSSRSRRSRKRKNSESDDEAPAVLGPRQCYGPKCTKPSQPGSKYCSDTCGEQLAANRICQVLPQRIQEWSLCPSISEENNKKALENVRKQQVQVRKILQELDKRHVELDTVIARGKQCKIDETQDKEKAEEEEMETETSMYCITCGHEIHSKTAIRHMDKCFNKYESQASFGSIYKTRIQGNNMFCDFYNASNKTYCKRLRVLCPEHSKEPKANPSEVCGCPLVSDVFKQTGEFCRTCKKDCVKHYAWEKLRRAEIDMERVRQWLKFDELVEKERQLRYELATRAGVLALMLHSTYNHEVMEQLVAQQQQQQQQQQHMNMQKEQSK